MIAVAQGAKPDMAPPDLKTLLRIKSAPFAWRARTLRSEGAEKVSFAKPCYLVLLRRSFFCVGERAEQRI